MTKAVLWCALDPAVGLSIKMIGLTDMPLGNTSVYQQLTTMARASISVWRSVTKPSVI